EEEGAPKYDVDAALWMLQQVNIYQTRLALISEKLAAKGYKVRPIVPRPPGLRCTRATEEHPVPCRIYLDAEPDAKVVAPCKCKG
ncbi:unnamed protein product, partial [Phaeothamnion confervicola]